MNEKQAKFMAGVPQSCVRIVAKAFEREGGRANAIKAFCLVCLNYNRKDIRECTAPTCPLYPWRPYQAKSTAVDATLSDVEIDDEDDTFDLPEDNVDDEDDEL